MQNELLPKYADQGFRLIPVNVGYEPAVITQLLEEAGVTLPVVFDLESELYRRVRAADWAFPLNIVVDREGKVALIQIEEDLDALDAAIAAALG